MSARRQKTPAVAKTPRRQPAGGPAPIVTLTTDFGVSSPYIAAMKGVMLSINRDLTIVDITHAIKAQDVRQGALILAETAHLFPPGTIHVAVVDPGVGTNRQILWAEINGRQFVLPDNGLLGLLADRSPPTRMRAVTEPAYWLHPVSATFHGRDILAPVAARLAAGLSPDLLGPPRDCWVELTWPEIQIVPGKIQGSVTRIDSFGNLITDITAE
ncbi:MAG: S-adenosyl-l-methionine hydroxide adenosyltransferase family protein, partial [Pirellulales bacterium]